jgi:hypothetical protein
MNERRTRSIVTLFRSLASLKLTVVLLLLLAALVMGGTVYQAGSGIYAAQARVFGSWFILIAGIIPLPGMLLVSLILFFNLLAAVIFRLRYSWRRAGLLLVHYGLLLLIGGGFFITVTAREYTLTLSEGESSRALAAADGRTGAVRPAPDGAVRPAPDGAVLPASITLLDFAKALHPGTDIPRSFSSRVEITSGGVRRQAVISMNRPLRYRGYTFYQSSYAEDARGGESSTFLVVRNSGRLLPYAASALLFLGLLGHFLPMLAAALKKPRPAEEQPRP